MDRLIAAAVAVNQDNLALGNETFEATAARFVRNVGVPDIWDANHVDRITASTPAEVDALLERAAREYSHCHHLRFDVDPSTPPQFEARLRLDGYEASEGLVSILEGELRATPPLRYGLPGSRRQAGSHRIRPDRHSEAHVRRDGMAARRRDPALPDLHRRLHRPLIQDATRGDRLQRRFDRDQRVCLSFRRLRPTAIVLDP